DHPAARHFTANHLRVQFFALRNVLHLLRDYALPRKVHLRNIAPFGHMRAVAVRCGRCGHCCFAFFNPAIAQSHKTPSEIAALVSQQENIAKPRCTGLEIKLWHLGMDAATSGCPDIESSTRLS